jgi:hypothetical protein
MRPRALWPPHAPLTAALLTATVLAMLAQAACAGPLGASASPPSHTASGGRTSPAAAGTTAPVGDLTHIKQVQAYLKHPASLRAPLVYYLGDSTVRESVVSEVALERAISAATPAPRASEPFVLASRNQTFPLDQLITEGLPSQPALVVIGVGLSRFTNPPATHPGLGPAVGATTALSPWAMHKYSASQVLSVPAKRALVQKWLAKRYPLFQKNEPRALVRLKALVQACQGRGWKVVLVDMPTNTTIIGHAFDAAKARYRADCQRLAASLGIAYLRFSDGLGLGNADFYDLIHMVGDGRTRFQRRLAAALAGRLPAPPRP